MRKEPIIAIFIGSLFGLGVAFFVWQYTNKDRSNIESNQSTKINENSPKQDIVTTTSEGKVSLISPLELSVYEESPITVSGIAEKNSVIAVASSSEIILLNTNSNGEFSTELEIESGYETINVYSFHDEVFSNSKVNIIYSNQLEESEPDNQLAKRSALLGSVTDISENTIQIKTPDDLIEQISISTDTTFANIISNSDSIEFSEIAIGDFIIGIGTKANNILEGERILISEVPSNSALNAVFGQIVTLSASEFIVTHADGEDYSIDATGKIDVTKFDEDGNFVRARLSETTEGDKIIIVGDLGEELTARRIHLFPSPAEE